MEENVEAVLSTPVNQTTSEGEEADEEVPVVLTVHKYNAKYKHFVCQLPQSPNKCYKFLLLSTNKLPDDSVEYSCVCARCRYINKNSNIDLFKYLVRTNSQGGMVMSSPFDNHLPDCSSEDHETLMKLYRTVEEHVKIKGLDADSVVLGLGDNSDTQSISALADSVEVLPVEISIYGRSRYFVCKLPDRKSPQMCIRFKVISNKKLDDGTMEFSMICPCRYKPVSSYVWKTNGLALSHPFANHTSRCRSLFYQEVVKKELKERVKEKILRGECIDMHLSPFGSPYVQPSDIANLEKTSFEGGSGCELLTNTSNVAELPVLMVANRIQPESQFFVCQLPDEPEKCLKFQVIHSEKLSDGTVEFSIECSKCQAVYGTFPDFFPKRKSDGLVVKNPLDKHLPKCHPWHYDLTIKKNPILSGQVREKILRGESIAIHLPPLASPFAVFKNNIATVPQSSALVDLLNERRENAVDMGSTSRKRKAGWTIHNEQCSSSMDTSPKHGSDESESLGYNSFTGTVYRKAICDTSIVPTPREKHHSQGISALSLLSPPPGSALEVKKEIDEPSLSVVSSPIPTDLPLSIPISVRKIQLAVPKKFEKKFDSNNFTEDEVDISVNGNVLRVLFERKSSIGPSRSSHSLAYEHDLPDYVIVDSLSTSWEKGQLIVTANTTST